MDIKMFFEARRVIETGLARLAAEHGTDEEIDQLFQILSEQKAAFVGGDQERLHGLDLAFHQQIADMASNNFLFQINEMLFANLDKLFRVLPLSENGWVLHYAVAEAIRDRSSNRAYRTMRTLIEASLANYLPYIEKFEREKPH
jgi:DNA-binding GntR family transcriptional regulator